MNLEPIDDRVVIVPEEEKEKKVGKLYIPDTAKEKPVVGKVVAVGTDEMLKEVISEGDKIIYAKYGGTEIELEGEKYIILSRPDILAKMK